MFSRSAILVLAALGVAWAALDAPCDPAAQDQCVEVANTFCEPASSTCKCNERFLPNAANDACDPVLGLSCLERPVVAACNKIPYALCVDTCECTGEYTIGSDSAACAAKTLGAHCLESAQCLDLGEADCVQESCQCKKGFVAAEAAKKCLPVAKRLGEECEETAECSALDTHAECVGNLLSKKCTCSEGWVANGGLLNNACLKTVHKVGDACTVNGQCNKFSGKCASNKCQCEDGNVPSADEVNCIPEVELEGSCQQDQQCLDEHSACTLGVCSCLEGYHPEEKVCVADEVFKE